MKYAKLYQNYDFLKKETCTKYLYNNPPDYLEASFKLL